MTAAERTDRSLTGETEVPGGGSSRSRADVVVGLDGSEHSRRALRWAVENTSGPIRLVVSWSTPWWGAVTPMGGVPAPVPPPDAAFESAAKGIVEAAQPLLDGASTVPALIGRGHAGQTLIDAATEHGRMLVVGSRGRGSVASALFGSVSAHCAAKSPIPVVVVPDGDVERAKRIVVGIDGSANSDAALRWALDNAADDAVIVAMGVWAPPMSFDGAVVAPIDEMQARYEQLVADALARANPANGQHVETVVTMGDPRHVLRSADADQIVIGARGHHGLEYLMLGSTASALVHQPLVPTVVVPATD